MAADKRLTILLTPAEYDELKLRAGLVPVSTWIRHKVLGVRDDGTVPMAPVPAKPGAYHGNDAMPTYIPDVEPEDVGSDSQDVPRVPDVPAVERSAPVRRETRAKPESAPTAPLFAPGAHPGAGVFNAATDLSEPAYKSHKA